MLQQHHHEKGKKISSSSSKTSSINQPRVGSVWVLHHQHPTAATRGTLQVQCHPHLQEHPRVLWEWCCVHLKNGVCVWVIGWMDLGLAWGRWG